MRAAGVSDDHHPTEITIYTSMFMSCYGIRYAYGDDLLPDVVGILPP